MTGTAFAILAMFFVLDQGLKKIEGFSVALSYQYFISIYSGLQMGWMVSRQVHGGKEGPGGQKGLDQKSQGACHPLRQTLRIVAKCQTD